MRCQKQDLEDEKMTPCMRPPMRNFEVQGTRVRIIGSQQTPSYSTAPMSMPYSMNPGPSYMDPSHYNPPPGMGYGGMGPPGSYMSGGDPYNDPHYPSQPPHMMGGYQPGIMPTIVNMINNSVQSKPRSLLDMNLLNQPPPMYNSHPSMSMPPTHNQFFPQTSPAVNQRAVDGNVTAGNNKDAHVTPILVDEPRKQSKQQTNVINRQLVSIVEQAVQDQKSPSVSVQSIRQDDVMEEKPVRFSL